MPPAFNLFPSHDSRDYKRYKPAISKVSFSYGKNLLNLGLIFFIFLEGAFLMIEVAACGSYCVDESLVGWAED